MSRASRPPFRNPVYALALRKYGQGPRSASGPITHLQAREGSGVAHSGGERGNGGGGAVVSRHPGTPTDPTAEHTSVLHALSGTMAGVLAKELSREAEVGPELTALPGAQIPKTRGDCTRRAVTGHASLRELPPGMCVLGSAADLRSHTRGWALGLGARGSREGGDGAARGVPGPAGVGAAGVGQAARWAYHALALDPPNSLPPFTLSTVSTPSDI